MPQNNHAQNFVLRHVLRAVGTDEPPVVHHAYPVGQIKDVVDVVTDQKNPDPFAFKLRDQLTDFLCFLWA